MSADRRAIRCGVKMTDLQARFCEEYIIDLHGEAAYVRAGYKARGASARVGASQLLTNPNIFAKIGELQKARSERTEITADRVLGEMGLISFSSLAHYYVDDEGNVQTTVDAPQGAIRALSSIKRRIRVYRRGDEDVKEVDVEIKLWSKDKGLENLAKHLGLLGPKGTEDDPVHIQLRGVNFTPPNASE